MYSNFTFHTVVGWVRFDCTVVAYAGVGYIEDKGGKNFAVGGRWCIINLRFLRNKVWS